MRTRRADAPRSTSSRTAHADLLGLRREHCAPPNQQVCSSTRQDGAQGQGHAAMMAECLEGLGVTAHAAASPGGPPLWRMAERVSRNRVASRTARWSAHTVRGDYSPDINLPGSGSDFHAADRLTAIVKTRPSGEPRLAAGGGREGYSRPCSGLAGEAAIGERFVMGLVGGPGLGLRHAGIPKRPGGGRRWTGHA